MIEPGGLEGGGIESGFLKNGDRRGNASCSCYEYIILRGSLKT